MHNRIHRYASLTGILALSAAATMAPADGLAAPTAHAARTVSLNETGRLHLVSKHGFTLYEKGTATGTIKGPISVVLKIVSSSRVSMEVTVSPSGGSLSGSGSASYRRSETSAGFAGSLSIGHRSGTYAHAVGSGLKFHGTISRSTDAITVYLSGRLSY